MEAIREAGNQRWLSDRLQKATDDASYLHRTSQPPPATSICPSRARKVRPEFTTKLVFKVDYCNYLENLPACNRDVSERAAARRHLAASTMADEMGGQRKEVSESPPHPSTKGERDCHPASAPVYLLINIPYTETNRPSIMQR